MTILAKIYKDFTNQVLIQDGQVFIESVVSIDEDVNDFDVAKFEIAYSSYMQEDCGIQLIENENGIETQIFEGFIFEVTPNFERSGIISVVCRSQKALMTKRKALNDANLSGDISVVLQQLLGQFNVAPYSEGRQVFTDFTKNVTIEVKIGDEFYDLIDELARQCEAKRDLVDKTLNMLRIFYVDRSLPGSNYTEIIFDGIVPYSNNINKIQLTGTSTRANIAIGIDQSGTKHKEEDMTDGVVYGVIVEQFRDGNLVEKTQQLLARMNVLQRIYKIEVATNAIVAGKGDKIRMIISNAIEMMNIDTAVYVLRRNITYNQASRYVNIYVSDITVSQKSVYSTLLQMKKKIDILGL